ncbi:Histidine N-alpha-methyltransferase [Acaryochloris thomasi RCC1774]|uniref:Histidine N-alpha-methyltransferase n=1 Tax=Acaryochloris thomasi RCC1774 TaxID=1764569 RepID=A0A2W1JPG7_9CYAN|nr:L-histidine N(alpha)-methyltransferase [Acaryochloris thomasi]PZD75136.1 Histidine N-alpha-methyltransferase [Acaryochloris thomasi RCC1774]
MSTPQPASGSQLTSSTAPIPDFDSRLSLQQLKSINPTDVADGADVLTGLAQQTTKTLPPKYFYDDRGSALFEQICALPEYYVTRTETHILQKAATQISEITGPCELVELGSGSSTKTRILLDAYRNLSSPNDAPNTLSYLPIDVSGGILKESAIDLLKQYPSLQVRGLIGTYEQGLQNLPPAITPHRLICFLGSTLGNLSPAECQQFFDQVRGALQPGDYFLLGIDLQKSAKVLEAAYNDSQGITAAFNLNMLRHLNWRFQANFDLDQFQHYAFYNEQQQQIEMHLRSLRDQTVELAALDFSVSLMAGETIRTEISRKFDLAQLPNLLEPKPGAKWLKSVQTWTDSQGWFGLALCQAALE